MTPLILVSTLLLVYKQKMIKSKPQASNGGGNKRIDDDEGKICEQEIREWFNTNPVRTTIKSSMFQTFRRYDPL